MDRSSQMKDPAKLMCGSDADLELGQMVPFRTNQTDGTVSFIWNLTDPCYLRWDENELRQTKSETIRI